MGKFNTPTLEVRKTKNLAGGEAFVETPELELVSILLTSLVQDQFYKKADDTMNSLEALIGKVNPVFAAKAAIYARKEFGMRSISHVCAVFLGKAAIGSKWGSIFYEQVIRRPDDITEILALNKSKHGKTITHAMIKGLGKALTGFKPHVLAKYQGKRNSISLVDAVNFLHPRHSPALKLLVDGKLKQTNTWENQISEAGKAENAGEAKKEAWGDLLRNNKMGTMALLRNLRNILETKDGKTIALARNQLVNRDAIKRSLLFPYRFFTAYKEIAEINSAEARSVCSAISHAMDIAVDNVPEMKRTCVLVDVSGSMTHKMAEKSKSTLLEAALVLGCAMSKKNNSDLIFFTSDAKYIQIRSAESVLSNVELGLKHIKPQATYLTAAFEIMDKAYDNIIIFSDEQTWGGGLYSYNNDDSPTAALKRYKTKFHCDPKIFSVDMAGYGTLAFPERNVACMAGFSDKIFDIMKLLHTDKKALMKKILNIEL